jgi:hypothetical protein
MRKHSERYADENNPLLRLVRETKKELHREKAAPDGKVAWGKGLSEIVEEQRARLDRLNPPKPEQYLSGIHKAVIDAKSEQALADYRASLANELLKISKSYPALFTGQKGPDGGPVFKPEYEAEALQLIEENYQELEDGSVQNELLLPSGFSELCDHLAPEGGTDED